MRTDAHARRGGYRSCAIGGGTGAVRGALQKANAHKGETRAREEHVVRVYICAQGGGVRWELTWPHYAWSVERGREDADNAERHRAGVSMSCDAPAQRVCSRVRRGTMS